MRVSFNRAHQWMFSDTQQIPSLILARVLGALDLLTNCSTKSGALAKMGSGAVMDALV